MADTLPTDVLAGTAGGIGRQCSWTLTRTAEPAIEPVSLDEAKTHLRIDASDEDDYISALIVAARQAAEFVTGCACVEQSWELRFEGYMERSASGAGRCGEFRLRRSPVIAVDSIVYQVAGVATTLAAVQYVLDGARSKWPRVIPAAGASWAQSYWDRPVVISFRAGYAMRSGSPTEGAEKVPGPLKLAIKRMVSLWYENREPAVVGQLVNEMPMDVRFLLGIHRTVIGIA